MIPTPRNAETPVQWAEQSWPNVRAYLDEVMKLTAMLPGAVNAWEDDGGDHFAETLGKLSTQLYCVDMWLGENPPGYVPPRLPNYPSPQGPERESSTVNGSQLEPRTDQPGMHLYPGQVELITRLFHEATDAGCELLTVLANADQSEKALRSGTLAHLADRVVQAMWGIRWEMNIDSPRVDDAESEGDQ